MDLTKPDALVGDEQVGSLSVAEREVVLALVRGVQERLQCIESRLAPPQPYDEPQTLDVVDTTDGSAAAPDISTVVTFVPLESIELGVNGHGSHDGLSEPTDASPAKEAPEIVAGPPEDLPLPAIAEAHVSGIEASESEPVHALDAVVAVPSLENSDDEISPNIEGEGGVEVQTGRHTSLVRLSAEKLAQREQENTAALGGNKPVIEFTIVDDLGIRTSIREIRFRLARTGGPNLILTVVNTVLDQLIEQQRPELTGAELEQLTGFEANRIADNYNTWISRFKATPFLTRGFGGQRVYYLNPLYRFGDERQSGGDPEPSLLDPVETPAEADNSLVEGGEVVEAPVPTPLPDPEAAVSVLDTATDAEVLTPVEARSITEDGPVQLTNWGLEWTRKGGHPLVLLDGTAMIPMKPVMADALAFTAQSGGSVVFTDLLEALERRHPDLQPSDLMSALGQIEALFARHAIADKFTNEIVSKPDTIPVRLVNLDGVVAQPEGRDFLAVPTQMAS